MQIGASDMAIGKATGYKHQRTIGRASGGEGMRPTGKSEVMIGMFGLMMLLVVPAILLSLFFD
jgi:hypothetical protein